MIDFPLVTVNQQSLRNSLSNKEDVGVNWAYRLTNVFSDSFVSKVIAEFNTNTNWKTLDLQAHMDRKLIVWHSDSVVEEAHMVFESCQDDMSEMFKKKLTFSSVNFWQDGPTYTIRPHADTTTGKIAASIQVYIGESGPNSGTELHKDGAIFYKFPWQNNTGYVMNTVPESIHSMTYPGFTRRSVYAIYK